MTASTATVRARTPERRRPALVRRPEAPPRARLDLDAVAARWQLALDAAHEGLVAADASLADEELAGRRRDLGLERQRTAATLAELARVVHQPTPWLSPVPMTRQMLGLASTARACLFDLDGVLTDSALLHAHAWADTFDSFLLRVADRAGRHFIPFDRDTDYRAYMDGRARLEGIHAFLASRGIRVPVGRADDPAETETAHGLATRKSEALARRLRRRGVTALPGTRRYLEAAGRVGIRRAVVSSSATTGEMLELAGLEELIEERLDADAIVAESLRSRPAPDVLLSACRRLGIPPEAAVAFTSSPAGVAAAHAAGMAVVGVADGVQGEVLRGFGADAVVSSLGVLLDRRIAESR